MPTMHRLGLVAHLEGHTCRLESIAQGRDIGRQELVQRPLQIDFGPRIEPRKQQRADPRVAGGLSGEVSFAVFHGIFVAAGGRERERGEEEERERERERRGRRGP